MFHLPVVLVNMITQYLNDNQNVQFMQTCHAASIAIKHLPRESVFRVDEYSKDLYSNYRSIEVCLKSNDSLNITDYNYVAPRSVYVNVCNNFSSILSFLKSISMEKVRHLRFNCENIYELRGWCEPSLYIELNVRLERIPIYEHVRYLYVEKWDSFRALSHFPNITYLSISLLEDSVYTEYPDLPNLTNLWIDNMSVEEQYNFATDNETHHIPIWPSVTTIRIRKPIPIEYKLLQHVITDSLDNIPTNLECQILSITLDYSIYKSTMNKDLRRFKSLKKLYLNGFAGDTTDYICSSSVMISKFFIKKVKNVGH